MKDELNPYFDEGGLPVLRPSAVAYLDLLGFSYMISKAAESGYQQEQELLNRLSKALEKARQFVEDMQAKGGNPAHSVVKTFTDNLVWAYPFVDDGQWEVADVLFNIGHYQRELTLSGFLTRGAIAVGNIHVGEKIVAGGTILEAIKKECSAKYPRVILTNSLKKYINEKPIQFMDRILSLDKDGERFINYLHVFDSPIDGLRHFDLLMRHKSIIELKIQEFSKDTAVLGKYSWMADYHNDFCRRAKYLDESMKAALNISNERENLEM
jgi:hypothetical protein